MKCPKCGIRAAKNAISCFCGYEFIDRGAVPEKQQPDKESGVRVADENTSETGESSEAEKTGQNDSINGQQTEPDEEVEDANRDADETEAAETGGSGTGTENYPDATKAIDTNRRPVPRFDESVPRYDRVGGWLLLLCVSLTILGPLATLYNLTTGYSEVQELFDATPGLRTLYSAYSILSVGLGLFSLWAGFSLWTRMAGAVDRAKKYLYAVLGYSVILYFLPTMAGLPEEMSTEMQNIMAIASFRSVIYVVIWYLYLTKSKRVRGTYPMNG